MSVRVMSGVWQNAPYAGGMLLVLLALADWCDDDGYCWPSMPAIAVKARLSERQVQRILGRFREAGIITVERGNGRGHSSRYQFHLETLKPTSPIPPQKGDADDTLSADKRVTSVTERVTSTTEKGDICDIAIRKNRHDPSIEPSGQNPSSGGQDGKARDQKAVRWVFDYYVQALGRNPKTYLYDPDRQRLLLGVLKKAIRMRGSRENAVNFLAKCIDAMTESGWHMGRDPKTNGKTYNELENVFGPKKFQQWATAVEKAEQNEPDSDEVGAFLRSQEKAERLQ